MNEKIKMFEQVEEVYLQLLQKFTFDSPHSTIERAKRPIVEVEEEELEHWDEGDRVEYEKNKKFEQLATDSQHVMLHVFP